MSQTPAGWYPDAHGTIRWWDGAQWTEHVHPPAAPPSAVPQGPTGPPPSVSATQEFPTQGYSTQDYSTQAYPTQAYPAAYPQGPGAWPGEWPGTAPSRRGIRPWMVIAAGLVVLLVVVGVVLGVTLGGTGGTSGTSTQEFCHALDSLPGSASLGEAVAAVQAKGLPGGIPSDARHGFELYAQHAAQLDQAGSLSDSQLAALVGGTANVNDMRAFNDYVQTTCGGAPQSPVQ